MLIANWAFIRKWDVSVGGRKGTVKIGAAGGELGGNFMGDFTDTKDDCTGGRGLVYFLLLKTSVISTFILLRLSYFPIPILHPNLGRFNYKPW